MMLIGDDSQCYPSYRDIAALVSGRHLEDLSSGE
jgi:hypothetical protein